MLSVITGNVSFFYKTAGNVLTKLSLRCTYNISELTGLIYGLYIRF